MVKTKKPIGKAPPAKRSKSGSEKNVQGQLKAPFPVLESEKSIYQYVSTRPATTPIFLDTEHWEQRVAANDPFAERFVYYLKRLGVWKFAGFKSPAYRGLIDEFYTSFRVRADGLMSYRFGGDDFALSTREVKDHFGFDGRSKLVACLPEYNEEEMWKSITIPHEQVIGFPMTLVNCNALYAAYRYLTMCVFGKGEPTKMTKDELYLFWCMREGHPVQLLPFIIASIEHLRRPKIERMTLLSHGLFISEFAAACRYMPRVVIEIAPRSLSFGTRLIRIPGREKGVNVPITQHVDYEAVRRQLEQGVKPTWTTFSAAAAPAEDPERTETAIPAAPGVSETPIDAVPVAEGGVRTDSESSVGPGGPGASQTFAEYVRGRLVGIHETVGLIQDAMIAVSEMAEVARDEARKAREIAEENRRLLTAILSRLPEYVPAVPVQVVRDDPPSTSQHGPDA